MQRKSKGSFYRWHGADNRSRGEDKRERWKLISDKVAAFTYTAPGSRPTLHPRLPAEEATVPVHSSRARFAFPWVWLLSDTFTYRCAENASRWNERHSSLPFRDLLSPLRNTYISVINVDVYIEARTLGEICWKEIERETSIYRGWNETFCRINFKTYFERCKFLWRITGWAIY